jgi:hypothetical protein
MNKKNRTRSISTAVILLVGLGISAGIAQTKPSWLDVSRLTSGFRWSEDVQEYYADALVPIVPSGDTRLYLDIRGTFLEDEEQELNAGFVARRLLRDQNLILGINAFYDTRWTEQDNTFDQVGLGLELFTRQLDLRFNYYYPLNDEELVGQSSQSESATQTSSGRRITTTTTTFFNIYEEAMEGFDVEAGYWLPFMESCAPTALYVGYYDFDSSYGDDISGVKARIEARVHPNVTIDAEWYDSDDLNRTEYFVGARFSVPIDFWNGAGRAVATDAENVHPMEARLNEMVNRDFRIRTRITDPVVVGHDATQTSSQAERQVQTDDRPPIIIIPRPPEPEPPPPPPPDNCRIDPITGDVICD